MQITKHPLYSLTDKFVRAFAGNGFFVINAEDDKELLKEEDVFKIYDNPYNPEIIKTTYNNYVLRPRLLPLVLGRVPLGQTIKAIAYGNIYDGKDKNHPSVNVIEGIIAIPGMTFIDHTVLWDKVMKNVYGVATSTTLVPNENDVYDITVSFACGDEFTVGTVGKASWIAKSMIRTQDIDTFAFEINVDNAAMNKYGYFGREDLYNVKLDNIKSVECDMPDYSDSFASKVRNVLRAKGYSETVCLKAYEDDCYTKMNMIQDKWDTNNAGVQLETPLGKYTQLPTVLSPSLEEALSQNSKAGFNECKVFEIGHIFKPGKNGDAPMDKLSLSIGCYGENIDIKSFRSEIDTILTEMGISNHFFIPTNMAIAYNTSHCFLVLSEKMQYLDGNFGEISPKARENHGIAQTAYMAQFELPTLEAKANSEYGFVPNELK